VGLDWNPLARPKAGAEAEFERLIAVNLNRLSDDVRQAVLTRFGEITEPPYATLGSPRVGFDPEADEWLRDQLRGSGQEGRTGAVARVRQRSI
jgi:hypothetical protein